MNRWSKAGVLDRVFARLQEEQILAIRIEHVCLDSTTISTPRRPPGRQKTSTLPPGDLGADAPPKFVWFAGGAARCALMLKAFRLAKRGMSARTGIAGAGGPASRAVFDRGAAPIKGMKPCVWRVNWVTLRSRRPTPSGWFPGPWIGWFIAAATRSNAYSVGSKPIAGFFAASTSSMCCSLASSSPALIIEALWISVNRL